MNRRMFPNTKGRTKGSNHHLRGNETHIKRGEGLKWTLLLHNGK